MSDILYAIPVQNIAGETQTLESYRGKVLLIVNVASKCGLTPQYEGLEQLYREKQAQGFEVLGFPANDFKGQEPGSDDEIRAFCRGKYDVTFPLFSKISVVGPEQHPLYQHLTQSSPAVAGDTAFRERLKGYGIEPNPEPAVLWNFEKFLIDRDGEVIGRFAPNVAADDTSLRSAIEVALA
jgi:glutathione peroxidase